MNSISKNTHLSVIIPTMATRARRTTLERAVCSVRRSSLHPITIIVVVNGEQFDTGICDWLKAQADVHFDYVRTPSLSGAVLRGRLLVQTEFFSTLDDDDEYLAGSSDQKISQLRSDLSTDLLVGNAFRNQDGRDTLMYSRLPDAQSDPLRCLFQFPWLSSGNALYRSSSDRKSTRLNSSHPRLSRMPSSA